MTKRFILDTNTLLRFLLNDNQSQATKTTELLKKAKAKKIEVIVPQIVIFEIAFALIKIYKLTKEDVIKNLKVILDAPYVKVSERALLREALDIFVNHNISLVDCFLLSLSRHESAQLLTFDKALQKLL